MLHVPFAQGYNTEMMIDNEHIVADCDCIHMTGLGEHGDQLCNEELSVKHRNGHCPFTAQGGKRWCKFYKSKVVDLKGWEDSYRRKYYRRIVL